LMLGGRAQAYQIEQSLRFDGSNGYLSRTHSNNNVSSDFTLSMWLKKAYNGENNMMLIHTNPGTNYSYVSFGESSGDADLLTARGTSSGYAFNTSRKYRDNSAWYHIVLSVDVGTLTEAYVNGVLDQNTGPTSGWYFNSNQAHGIGATSGSASNFFSGYMAEVHFIDGQALDADSFGEFDDNGVWRPIKYTGTYGDNGFYLKFDPDATNGVGHDHSGNGNNWTATGFTTSGTGTDVMSDTPTNNYCTLNPLATTASGNPVLSEGNLVLVTPSVGGGNGYGTMAIPSSGKWYWEAHVDANSGGAIIGIAEYSAIEDYAWQLGNSAMYYFTGEKFIDGTATSYGSTYTAGDLIGVACDADAGTIQFYKEGTAQGSISHEVSGLFPCLTDGSSGGGCTYTINFGQRDFEQTVPTGYSALNTSSLPAPDIADGSQYFNTVLYTGTGSYPRAVTGASFSPDWVWLKSRSDGYGHGTYDRVRGVGTSATALRIDSTSEEGGAPIGPYIDLDSLDSDGFTLGNTVSSAELFNLSTKAYAAWCWKADNTSGSSNTAGSVTSTVSANPSAGFSIVTYAGSGTGGDSIGHGLGVPPQLIIAKSRGGGPYPTASWAVYHESIGASKSLALDTTGAAAGPYSNPGTIWYNTAPTSTVFYVGNLNETNGSNDYVAYCFAEVEGYSKFGTYVGTSNFPFINCGFRPAFIILKPYDLGSGWYLYDSTRGEYNGVNMRLLAESPAAETSVAGNEIDILSNGFKLRGAYNSGSNYSGASYVFCAWAEHPFGGDGVSPATAR